MKQRTQERESKGKEEREEKEEKDGKEKERERVMKTTKFLSDHILGLFLQTRSQPPS